MSLLSADADLFLAVLPLFVLSLPSRPPPPELNEAADLELLNLYDATTNLRFEIQEMPKVFDQERAYALSKESHHKGVEALEEVLYCLEDLVDLEPILSSPVSKLPRLDTLREKMLMSNCPPETLSQESPQLPSEVLQWIGHISYDRGRKKAVQYRRIFQEAQRFNQVMREIFESEDTSLYPVSQLFEKSRHEDDRSSAGDIQDNAEIQAAKKLSEAAAAIANSILEVRDACQPPHTLLISLSGFESPEINTIMTLCPQPKSEQWQWVHWTWESPIANRAAEETSESKCGILKVKRKHKRRLHVRLNRDGTWSDSAGIRENNFATAPSMTLEEALNPEKNKLSMVPELLKKNRLELAIRIARSLLHLLWSPLLQSPLKSEAVYVIPNKEPSQNINTPMDLYITAKVIKDYWPDKTTEVMAMKSFVLYLGAMLWELLFVRKVEVTHEDEEEDETEDEDKSLSLYNALNREQFNSRNSFIDEPCLNVISNCLDLYADDYSDQANFRSQVYHRVVKPLKNYFKVKYNPVIQSGGPKARAVVRPFTKQPAHLMDSLAKFPSHRPAPYPMVNSTMAQPTTTASLPAPDTATSFLDTSRAATLLVSRGNIQDSHAWLERFDLVNERLKNSGQVKRPVRVAILDTGCDLEDDFFAGPGIDYTDCLTEHWLDCVDGTSEPVDEDLGRHGTSLTALALRLLPSPSSLYVVRVARSAEELLAAKQQVAQAITHVVEEWDVDIISMSFGFGVEVQVIQSAIAQAEKHKGGKVLFFGLNQPEMFPAFSEAVISVRGTSNTGAFEPRYNPDTWGHKERLPQYGTLGLDVSCGWHQGGLVRGGCSVATPILGAIAAVIISLVDLNEKSFFPNAPELVRTRRGILSVFRVMTESQGQQERLYLAPWQLYEHSSGEPVNMLYHALSKIPKIDG